MPPLSFHLLILLTQAGANPDLDAALAAVRSSPSLWHFCYRLRTGRGTDALLDVPSVGHHR
jgi:hypothetical protein